MGSQTEHALERMADDNARLCAEVERRRSEYDRLWKQRDRIHAMHIEARAEVERLRAICARVVEWSEVGEPREGQWHCRVCGETGRSNELHDEACPVLRAVHALKEQA